MTRKTKAISEELVEACKAELKRLGPSADEGRKLQAIISAQKYGISAVAQIYDISRETMMRWIGKFKKGGSKAFAVEAGRGRPSKLTAEQKQEVEKYIAKEGATLSSNKLQLVIEERYSVKVSSITAYRLLKSSGYSYITPRPSHHKKQQSSQDEFKKKSRTRNKKIS
jgi:transposase